MKVQAVTKSKYAEMRGCAASAVTKAIQEGRITTVQIDGREMIDPEVADIQWQRNTRARADSTSAAAAPTGRSQYGRVGGDDFRDMIRDNEGSGPVSYEEARRRRETAEAEIAEMKQAEMAGTLIRADAVRSALAAKITSMRDSLLQIPSRLGPVVTAGTDLAENTAAIEDAIRQALAELSSQNTEVTI